MKWLLASLGVALLPPLAHASTHSESLPLKVLSEGQQSALNFQPGSFAALSRLDRSLPSGLNEWSGTILADWSTASRFDATRGEPSDWNPADWNKPWWHHVPDDDDLGRIVDDGGGFG